MSAKPTFHPDATRAALEAMRADTKPAASSASRIVPVRKSQIVTCDKPPIYTGSISRLHDFEKCPYKAYLKHVEHVELTPEQRERLQAYADRGTKIHDAAECFVTHTRDDIIPELKHFNTELLYLRDMYKRGLVSCEEEWALDKNWQPTEWKGKNTWIRMKLDFFARLNQTECLIGDYKSGKKFGNEVKHGEQGQLYAIAAHGYYPQFEAYHTEFWYTDQNDMSQVEYGARHLARFKQNLGIRFTRLTTAVQFPPKPNIFNCQYCEFNRNGTGHCGFGICDIPAPRRKEK